VAVVVLEVFYIHLVYLFHQDPLIKLQLVLEE
jgi:hypothetical protein